MIASSAADSCEYNGHLVHVRASLIDNAWTYTVDIKTPEGNWLPPISDHDHVYDTSDAALAEGMSVGKHVAGG